MPQVTVEAVVLVDGVEYRNTEIDPQYALLWAWRVAEQESNEDSDPPRIWIDGVEVKL